MRSDIVLTLTGPDRVGLVEEVTRALFELGGNVEASRMARLGGEFSVIVLASLPAERASQVEAAFAPLVAEGYVLAARAARPAQVEAHVGWVPFRIEVEGADHEGIVLEIARGLSQRGIQIESADAGTTAAPVSGIALFSMTATVLVPPSIAEQDWQSELAEAGHQANVDITVTPLAAE